MKTNTTTKFFVLTLNLTTQSRKYNWSTLTEVRYNSLKEGVMRYWHALIIKIDT
jgi:hypothetical protein